VALPEDLPTITVTGNFISFAGNAASGSVQFTPTAAVSDPGGDLILAQTPITVPLVNGAFSIVLPCTDTPNLLPQNWGYQVSVAVAGASRVFYTPLPSGLGDTVDLSQLTPVPAPVANQYPADALGSAAAAQAAAEAYAAGLQPTSGSPLPLSRGGTGVSESSDGALLAALGAAPLASPDLTGSPTAPTQTTGDASTKIATDAFVATAAANAQSNAEAASLPIAGGTMTGYLAAAAAALTGAASTTVNAAAGNDFTLTLTSSSWTVANPSSPVPWQVIRFHLMQGSGGSFTVAWGTAYDFGVTGSPVLSITAGKVDIVAFQYDPNLSKWCCLGSGLGY